MEKVTAEIKKCENEAVQLLAEVIEIKSLSSDIPNYGPELLRMAEWIQKYVKTLDPKAKCELVETGGELPPLVLAELTRDEAKKTLLIYGHYDVQPAKREDGWDTDPWKMEIVNAENDAEFRGRGTTDDKGPIIGWLCMVKAFITTGTPMPVNLKFIFEGMEESGSLGFDETCDRIKSEKLWNGSDFFAGVDYCCISDNYWLTTRKPCVTHGLRGLLSCEFAVEGFKRDLHSGAFGGMVYEPMDDVVRLFASLKDADNNILIPGISDTNINPITDRERESVASVDWNAADCKRDIGAPQFRDEADKAKCLMNVWRLPALSIHGMEGAFSDSGFKTVIPRRVVGKFSIRLVPFQDLAGVQASVKAHLEKVHAASKSPNPISIKTGAGAWWFVSPDSPLFGAASRAVESVHGVAPDFTREGGAIPVAVSLSKITGRDMVLIPMGRSDDGAHSQNEKLNRSNFIQGIHTFARFLHELGAIPN